MALIDFVECRAEPGVYAWKFPEDNLSTLTQLVVAESQEAVLFGKGKIVGSFGPGRHTLTTENLPLLRNLFGLPFGGKNPFLAQVWYVNKAIKLDVNWGTPTPIQLRDPEFGIMVPVRAFGQFGLQINNATDFLVKLVGALTTFDQETMSRYFKGILLKHITDVIAKKIAIEKIPVLEISAQTVAISDFLKEALTPEFAEYGVRVASFNITSINVPDNDPSVVNLRKVLDKRLEMQALGFTYQQERSYEVMEKAAGNQGTAGGIMGAGLGLGMGASMGGVMGGMMSGPLMNMNTGPEMTQAAAAQVVPCPSCKAPVPATGRFCGACGSSTQQPTAVDTSKLMVACDKCQALFQTTVKFCPSCADPYNPCGACNADNPDGAKACRECGKPLPVACRHCDAKNLSGAAFCSNCGQSMAPRCAKCEAALTPGAKFCSECGTAPGG